MLQSLRKAPSVVSNLKGKVRFPNKLKGTIIEKWADYWKNLFIDYRQMLQDLRSDIQDEPKKALMWATGIASVYWLARNNPDELDFKNQLKAITNEISMLSEDCRNPESVEHTSFLQKCYNQDVIHYKSLGIVSFMYITDLNDSCDLYKAHCKYLKPTYFSFPSRIIDVGIMGRWWNIYIKTTDYDVNV